MLSLYIDKNLEKAYCPHCKKWRTIPAGAVSIEMRTWVASMIFEKGCQICRLKRTVGTLPADALRFIKGNMYPEEFAEIKSDAERVALDNAKTNPWMHNFVTS